MADDSLDPRDQIKLTEGLDALKKFAPEIDLANRKIDALTKETKAESTRADKRAAKQAKEAKVAAARKGAGVTAASTNKPLSEIAPDPVEREKATRGADKETGASQRARKAKAAEAKQNEALTASEQRLAKARAKSAADYKVRERSAFYELREHPDGRYSVNDRRTGEILADHDTLGGAGRKQRSFERAQDRFRGWQYQELLPGGPRDRGEGQRRAEAEAEAEAHAEDERRAREERNAKRREAYRLKREAELAARRAAAEPPAQRLLNPGRPFPQSPYAPPGPRTPITGYPVGYEQRAIANAEANRRAQLQLPRFSRTRTIEQTLRDKLGQAPPAGVPTGTAAIDAGTRAAAEAARQTEVLTRARQGAARASAAEGDAVQRTSRVVGQSSDQFRRHGALTTEFITAAAKGQTTMRELGYQTAATIGKFAGWTAAAAGVYGALAAVSALGRGAIESESGLAKLQRVTTKKLPGGNDELQERFRDLSQQFNVPISEVVEAAYGSAKAVGGDLNQALKATEQALFGVKVGELSVEESTQGLTAILNGFRLEAEQLPEVFDTINQATNRFGGSAGDLQKGVAKSAGAFRNAGGDPRELIALLTTGTKTTGKTYEQVGTAVQRSVSRTQTPQGAKALRAAGLDPTLEYVDLVQQAMTEAQDASANRVNELARALIPAGGQYASTFVPILQNQGRFQEIFDELSPDNVRGSATRELEVALSAINEQVLQIVTNLEQLGSSFAQAGGLTVLGGFVVVLNKSLDLATSLLDVFNDIGGVLTHIPVIGGSIYKALLPALQVAVVLKALRRLDAGSALPEGGRVGSPYNRLRAGLRRRPEQELGARIRQGVDDERRFLQETRSSSAKSAVRSAYAQDRALIESTEARRRLDTLPADASQDDRERAHANAAAAHERYEQTVRQTESLERDQLYAAERINSLKERELHYMQLRKAGLSEAVAAERAGIQYAPSSLDRPDPGQPVRLGSSRLDSAQRERNARILAERFGRDLEADRVYLGPTGRQLPLPGFGPPEHAPQLPREKPYGYAPQPQFAALSARGRTRDAALQGLEREQRLADREARRLASAGQRSNVAGRALGGSLALAGAGLRGATGALKSVGGGLRSIFSELGALDKAILGITAGVIGYQAFRNDAKTAKDAIAASRRQATSAADARSQQDALRAEGRHFGVADYLRVTTDSLGELAGGLIPGFSFESQDEKRAKELRRKQAEEKRLAKAQPQGQLLTLGQIQGNLKRRLNAARNDAEIDDALNTARIEIAEGLARTGGSDAQAAADQLLATINGRKAAVQAGLGNLTAAAKLIDDATSLKAYTDAVGTRFALEGPTKRNFQAAARGVIAGRGLARTDPDNAATHLAEAAENQAIIDQQAQARLQRDLAVARTPRQKSRARSTFLTSIKVVTTALAAEQKTLAGRIRGTEFDVVQAERAVEAAENASPLVFGSPAARAARVKTAKSHLAELQVKLAELRARRNAVASDVRQLEADVAAQEAAIAQDSADNDALFDARTAVGASKISDPVKQARYLRDRANKDLRRRTRRDGKGSVSALNAEANAGNTQQQLDQAVQADLEKQQADRERARAEAERAANEARAAAEKIRQDALDLLNARAEYAKSRTDDPNKQADIDLRLARDQQKYARSLAERLSARANVNNAQKAKRDVRLSGKADDIDYKLEFEQITRDEAIRQYEKLLKAKDITKAMYRDFKRKIKALKGEDDAGSLDLNLGSIRVPTTYEIRRATTAARAQAQGAPALSSRDVSGLRATANNYGGNTVNITVNDPGAVDQVYDALDRYHMGPGRSADRAAGRS